MKNRNLGLLALLALTPCLGGCWAVAVGASSALITSEFADNSLVFVVEGRSAPEVWSSARSTLLLSGLSTASGVTVSGPPTKSSPSLRRLPVCTARRSRTYPSMALWRPVSLAPRQRWCSWPKNTAG